MVKIKKWNPDWLPNHADSSLIAPTLRRELRRPSETCSADPFLVSLGRKEYLSPALREAMRTVITAPAGATLLVNFPTGSGKSLLAQVPALLSQDGLSVVVVPTTALCIDQERALKDYECQNRIEHETAFYGSSDEQKAIQKGICQRINNGTQRIVFASPEMVCGRRLFSTLWKTASAGKLEWLVIDEAHMVEHWGDSFRPKYQQLAGVRRGLLRQTTAKPFRTLLMSATMTAQTIDTLKSQFGEPGPFECIHSVRIRPEIASGVVKCDSIDSRMERTIDAILNLPKPLIAYTTKVADSQAIHSKLKEKGLNRIACFNGKTNDTFRETIINDFRYQNIDIVIATSAFGMGIDAEVRSVVHSCIPESFDRYYQEIGRGGRDGKASISLVIYAKEDSELAKHMSRRANIGRELGLRRWRYMHHQMTPVDENLDLYAVAVNNGITPNQRNLQWDDHTLNLLASAGVISFDAIPPPQWDPNAAPDTQEDLYDQRIIRVHDSRPTDEDTWVQRVEPVRNSRWNSSP
ncbi:MAG: protein DpdF, partial [Verrucomicrobiota bacterium]